jgi:integrase/recombinase XerD
MPVSYKAVLGHHKKADGSRPLYLQVIIDRKRVVFPVGVSVTPQQFDKRTGTVRHHQDAQLINAMLESIRSKASRIALEYMLGEKVLTPERLRMEMNSTINKQNFIAFARKELELRQHTLSPRTAEQNDYALQKIEAFRPVILFSELTVELIQQYQAFERRKYGNSDNTINKTLTTWKLYINAAKKKGIKFNDPFDHIKIRKVKPPKVALSLDEVLALVTYFGKENTPGTHKHVLRYFLFCCANGIRISDIGDVRWDNLSGNTLRLVPIKTKRTLKAVTIPLSEFERSLLPPCTHPGGVIFKCYAHPVTNRYLKEIARAVGIKKNLTFHMSRHTFGTLFLERGGRVEVLKELMGHSAIETTMVYVHMSDKRKVEQKSAAFDDMR